MAVFADAVCRCSLEATSYCSPPSRGRLRRIAPPSHCKDRRSQRSPHVTALQAQSELPVKRGAWAAAATQTVQAAFVRWLVCGRLRSLYTFSTGNRSGSSFVVAMFAGFDFVVSFPMLRQPQQFSRLHLNQREHLAALGDQCVVSWTRDAEVRTRTARAPCDPASPQLPAGRPVWLRVDNRSRCGPRRDRFPFAPSPRPRARALPQDACALSQ